MKAIIEVGPTGSLFATAKAQIAAARHGQSPDFHLAFESARTLFSELTPARLDLLSTLRAMGPSSAYALAKRAARNYSNVHGDIARLTELGLVERTEDDTLIVPFDAVEIHMDMARAA